eukprot:1143811-Pelagomonas_calceolata.AAC.1
MWSISSQRGHLPELEENLKVEAYGVAYLLVSKSRDWVVCFSVCSGGGWYVIVKFLPSLVVVARDISRAKLVFLVHMCFKFVVQVGEIQGLKVSWKRHVSSIQPSVKLFLLAVTLHAIFSGIGGMCYTEHTLNQLKELGMDHQCAFKLALKLQTVEYAHKLVTARRAIEDKNTPHSQVLEPGASSNPPDHH